MEQPAKSAVKLIIAKAEDRKLIASILFDNGYPVKPAKENKRKADGTETKATQYVLVVDQVEATKW